MASATQIEKSFTELVYDSQGHGSWYEALSVIKNQIGWLEYVPESELTDAEQERLINAAAKLFKTLRILTAKYVD